MELAGVAFQYVHSLLHDSWSNRSSLEKFEGSLGFLSCCNLFTPTRGNIDIGKIILIHLLSEDFRDLFVVLIYKLLKGSALHLHNVCCTREWDRDLLQKMNEKIRNLLLIDICNKRLNCLTATLSFLFGLTESTLETCAGNFWYRGEWCRWKDSVRLISIINRVSDFLVNSLYMSNAPSLGG